MSFMYNKSAGGLWRQGDTASFYSNSTGYFGVYSSTAGAQYSGVWAWAIGTSIMPDDDGYYIFDENENPVTSIVVESIDSIDEKTDKITIFISEDTPPGRYHFRVYSIDCNNEVSVG